MVKLGKEEVSQPTLMSMTVQQFTQTGPNVDRGSRVFHSLLDCRLGSPSSPPSFDCIVKWCDDGGDEQSRPSTLFSLLYKALTSLCVRDRRNRGNGTRAHTQTEFVEIPINVRKLSTWGKRREACRKLTGRRRLLLRVTAVQRRGLSLNAQPLNFSFSLSLSLSLPALNDYKLRVLWLSFFLPSFFLSFFCCFHSGEI